MKSFIAAALLLLMTISCSGPVPSTQLISTASAVPTPIAAITSTATLLPPTPTQTAPPTSEWNGIPIMPGAIAGEGDEEGYVFTIQATTQEVQDYYRIELEKIGWQPSLQEGDDSSLTLIFMDNTSATLTINILSKGEQSLVLLVK